MVRHPLLIPMKNLTISRERLTGNLDKYLAAAGLVLSLVLVLWLSLSIRKYIEVGIMLFMACAGYLIIRPGVPAGGITWFSDRHPGRSVYLTLNLAFLLLLLYNLAAVALRPDPYIRPLGYFVSVALMAGLTALEILIREKRSGSFLILLKISLIALDLIWVPQMIFPGLIGVDTWQHQMFTLQILETGTIPGDNPYSRIPLFHMITGAASLITGLEYKPAALLSVSLLQINGLVLVFLLGRLVLNSKAGLLAALFLGTGVEWIPWGTGPVPTSLAMVLAACLMYLVLSSSREKAPTLAALTLILTGALILTHTVTTLAVALLLFVFWAGFEVYKRVYAVNFRSPAIIHLALFCTTGMLAWWTFASGHISTLKEVLQWGFKVDAWSVSEVHSRYMTTVAYSEYFLNLLGFFLFIAFSIVGSFYLFSGRFGSRYSFVLVAGGAVLLTIGFLGLPLGLSGLLPHRWWFYSYFILAIPAAAGVILICDRYQNFFIKAAAAALLAAVIAFFSITAPTANFDNRIYSRNSASRNAFTEAELAAMNTVSGIWDGAAGVATAAGRYYFLFNRGQEVKEIASDLFLRDFSGSAGVMMLITDEIVDHYFDSSGGGIKLDYDPRAALEQQGFNLVYHGGTSTAYVFSGLPGIQR